MTAQTIDKQYKLFLNGKWQDSTGKDFIEVINPANKQVIAKVTAANEEDVLNAVAAAYNALDGWKYMEPEVRISYLRKYYDYLKKHEQEIANTLSSELGVPHHVAAKRHVAGYYAEIESYIKAAEKINWVEEKEGYELHQEAVGVAALITPWNYPFGQIVRKVFPALLTGNTVIVKPSQKTPLTSYYFAKAAIEAGLPDGIFQLIPGRGAEVGDVLASHPLINKISFTGSTSGGIELAKLAMQTVKRVTLELGGKSPAILLEDADLDLASTAVLNSLFLNVGQTCSAASRLIAPRSLKNEVERIFVDKAKLYQFGDPNDQNSDAGPLQSQQQLDKVNYYIERGKNQATLLYQGEVFSDKGFYIAPTIFTDVDNKSEIAQEEIFGPVLSIIYYDTIEEAIKIANDVKYGLSSRIYGNVDTAKAVARRILAGEVYINDSGDSSNAPFGGFKQSGFGREGNELALRSYLEVKAVIV